MGWLQEDSPIVALDIDNTLGMYHWHFTRFAEQWVGRELPQQYRGDVPFYSYLGLSKATYRKCKLAYRRGGLKRSMPMFEGAAEMTRAIRQRKGRIVVCTTRPFLSLEDVEPDTIHNLKRNGVQFDYIISGENKYRELVKLVDPKRIVMVLEDEDGLLRQCAALSLPAVRSVTPWNVGSSIEWTPEVRSIEAAKQLALHRMHMYSGDKHRAKERERKRA